MLNITVTNRNTSEKKRYKFTQNTILIGRQANCDIMLESTTISRRHARILVNKNLIEVEDLGSGNGTIINQSKIKSHDKAIIKPGDTIRIEEFEIVLDQKDMTDIASITHKSQVDVTDPDILEIKMIKKVLGAMDQDKHPNITITTAEFKGAKAVFKEGLEELIIGRDEKCDLSLNAAVVSRKHAIVSVKWGGFVVTDLESKNGTFVNGERITEKSIKDGDEIVFGTIKAIFRNPQEFDIAAITRSIESENERRKKEEVKVAQEKEVIASETIRTEQKKPASQTNISDAEMNDLEASAKSPFKKEKAQVPVPATQNKLSGFFQSLSTLEKGLFGFGILVIVVVVIFLSALLGN